LAWRKRRKLEKQAKRKILFDFDGLVTDVAFPP